jgi:hypothetical protein
MVRCQSDVARKLTHSPLPAVQGVCEPPVLGAGVDTGCTLTLCSSHQASRSSRVVK